MRAGRESPRAARSTTCAASIAASKSRCSKDRRRSAGHFFYREDMRGLNFERRPATISATIERLLAQATIRILPALYIESTPTPEYLPPFAARESQCRCCRPSVDAAHLDRQPLHGADAFRPVEQHRLRGRRPAALHAVSARAAAEPLHRPDRVHTSPARRSAWCRCESRPRALSALRRSAGGLADAPSSSPATRCYIPYGWWHHVESLTPFNVLANYWWNDARAAGSPFDCMLHAVLALRDLPPEQRAVWHTLFEHYVFTSGENPWRTCRASSAACWARRPRARRRPSAPSSRAPSPAEWGHSLVCCDGEQIIDESSSARTQMRAPCAAACDGVGTARGLRWRWRSMRRHLRPSPRASPAAAAAASAARGAIAATPASAPRSRPSSPRVSAWSNSRWAPPSSRHRSPTATDAALLIKHFSSITAENAMKPDTSGPTRRHQRRTSQPAATPNFAPADMLADFRQSTTACGCAATRCCGTGRRRPGSSPAIDQQPGELPRHRAAAAARLHLRRRPALPQCVRLGRGQRSGQRHAERRESLSHRQPLVPGLQRRRRSTARDYVRDAFTVRQPGAHVDRHATAPP